MRCYCSSKQTDWSLYVSQCEFALNSSVQDATGNIPFVVLYGCVPQLPLDSHVSSIQQPSVVDFITHRDLVQKQVKANLELAQKTMKTSADRKRREALFTVGQKVWLATTNLPLKLGTRKLAAKFVGPYVLLEEVAPAAWKLQLPDSFRIHPVFHVSQLKAVVGAGPSGFDTQAIELADQEEFEVEKIMDHKLVRRKEYFLIRWRGYSAFEDSWEPLENL